jgi:hypothetical protein
MTDFAREDDELARDLDRYRRRRSSPGWRLRAPLRTAEHVLRRAVADSRLRSVPVSAVRSALADLTLTGDRTALDRSDRVAVIASYSRTSRLSRSLVTLVDEFESNGYVVVLVRASESTGLPSWPDGVRSPSIVITKPNVGYDFGSWATALAVLPQIATKSNVILANDSLLGPFTSLSSMLSAFEGSASDVWGATDTAEHIPHLQSYLLGFRDGVLAHRALRSFWRTIRVIDDKDTIVARYEIGLSRLLATEGFLMRPWFDHRHIVPEGGNPTTVGGSRLVEAGFPFVKRILIENPDVFPDAEVARTLVVDRFGEDVQDWI